MRLIDGWFDGLGLRDGALLGKVDGISLGTCDGLLLGCELVDGSKLGI